MEINPMDYYIGEPVFSYHQFNNTSLQLNLLIIHSHHYMERCDKAKEKVGIELIIFIRVEWESHCG